MKTHRFAGLILTFLLSLGSDPAQAGPFTLSFNEYGDGLIDLRNGMGFQPLKGSLMDDPTWAGHQSLTYLLPTATVGLLPAGDVRVLELNLTVSDGIRFTNASGSLSGQTADRLIFYSADVAGGSMADTGLAPNFRTNTAIFERAESFTYQPDGPAGNVFNGATVPEPASLLMAGISGGFGLLWWWCQHRRTARSRGLEG